MTDKGTEMMKHWITRLTALLLLAALLTATALAANASGYSDVPDGHWAAQSVRRCTQLGLLQGVGGGKFGRGQEMTRAAYAAALCRLMGWQMLSPAKGSFDDNQNTAKWYYSAVETAAAHDAFPGHSRLCRPTDAITREEMAAMTVRALGYGVLAGILADADTQPAQSGASGFAGLTAHIGKNCPFADCTTNRGYIALAYRMGIMTGVNSHNFDPKATATREQAAAVLLRAYDRLHAGVSVRDAHWVAAEGEPGTLDVPETDCIFSVSLTARRGEQSVSPRAAIEEVYAAAVLAGKGGSVLLSAEPLAQKVNGKGVATDEAEVLPAEKLQEMLSDTKNTTFHRSTQYESSYLYHKSGGTTLCVWYESEDDLALKTALCRMLGVKTVYILREGPAIAG